MHQVSSREMETGGMNSLVVSSQVSLEALQEDSHHQEPKISHDDFLEQMLSTVPNCSWFLHQQGLPSSNSNAAFKPSDSPTDEHVSNFLCRNNDGATTTSLLLQQQQLPLSQPPLIFAGVDNSVDSYVPFDTPPTQLQGGEDASVQALFDTIGGSLDGNSLPPNMHHVHPPPHQVPLPASLSTGGSTGAPQRQRVRARRGQATDPHSIAERLRRERIAERMRALQELVPNGNKTDKASMLDEIIDYVKYLQLQVKVLSMSRLGGAPAVDPRVADMSSEGGEGGRNINRNQSDDSMTMMEHQVAKLMEEDMGSAMQYLQGKGLCLMPISLATAISTTMCHLDRTNTNSNYCPPLPTAVESSPNDSRLTVLSTTSNAFDGACKP